MTKEEFENQFDVLFNNITSNQAPGLNSYEKSVFLTKAQDEIVKSYFNPKLNKPMDGYDSTEKRQIDFSMIMAIKDYTSTAGDFTSSDTSILDTRNNTIRVQLPSDVMMLVNELVTVTRNSKPTKLSVVPVDYRSLAMLYAKPYKRPAHYQAWRIIDNSGGGNAAEIIPGANDSITKYTIRYVKRPYPIILDDFTNEGVSIEGKTLPYSDYTNGNIKIIRVDEEDILTGNTINEYDVVDKAQSQEDIPGFKNGIFIYDQNNDELFKIVESLGGYKWQLEYASEEEYEIVAPHIKDARYTYYLYSFSLVKQLSTQACELDPSIHEEILQRAVELAKAAWEGSLNSQIALGTNSMTNVGMLTSGGNNRQ